MPAERATTLLACSPGTAQWMGLGRATCLSAPVINNCHMGKGHIKISWVTVGKKRKKDKNSNLRRLHFISGLNFFFCFLCIHAYKIRVCSLVICTSHSSGSYISRKALREILAQIFILRDEALNGTFTLIYKLPHTPGTCSTLMLQHLGARPPSVK